MKLVAVIPTFSVPKDDRDLCAMAAQNAEKWQKQCDKLIICEDGQYCKDLFELADVYVMHPNLGVCANARLGWQIALVLGADYVALMDFDVRYSEGNLRDACIPGRVGVPVINSHPDTAFSAPMLVVPREVSDQYGIYDNCKYERDRGFDGTYWHKIKHLITQAKTLKVDHYPGNASDSWAK